MPTITRPIPPIAPYRPEIRVGSDTDLRPISRICAVDVREGDTVDVHDVDDFTWDHFTWDVVIEQMTDAWSGATVIVTRGGARLRSHMNYRVHKLG